MKNIAYYLMAFCGLVNFLVWCWNCYHGLPLFTPIRWS